MYALLVGSLLRWFIAQINHGRVARAAWFFHEDATFFFAGDSSWSGRREGREEIAEWLDRFSAVGLQLEVLDVMVAGPPWNLRIATLFRDSLVEEGGGVAYQNEGMFYDRVHWGRITHHESHEDTEKVAAFDSHLIHPGFR